MIFDYSSQDIIFTSTEINHFTSPNEGTYLNHTNGDLLSFEVYVNNGEYDNDDNPYG